MNLAAKLRSITGKPTVLVTILNLFKMYRILFTEEKYMRPGIPKKSTYIEYSLYT